MRRREFLKAGGWSLAALATPALPVVSNSNQYDGSQSDVITIRSSRLRVSIDPVIGLPRELELINVGKLIGAASSSPINATLFSRERGETRSVTITPTARRINSERADFLFEPRIDGAPAARFAVRYRIDVASLFITLEEVEERPRFELIAIQMPSLVTIDDSDSSTWLAHGDTGGSLAMLHDAKPAQLKLNTFWGDVQATLPITMVGNDKVTCVQEVTAFMDGAHLTVANDEKRKYATLGTTKKYRVSGSQCYDMNLGSGAPRNCGNKNSPNPLIGQVAASRLDFLPASRKPGIDSWLFAAKQVRDRMPASKTRYYDDKFVYGIHCDEPKYEKPRATFDQCAGLIQKVANLTAGSPQVVHLWGWQYRGKDTGYPAVAQVNERLGGYDALQRLMKRGRNLNANVTFSDNYDDAYRSSPAWDPAIIARRPDGELWESRNWTGENSYIVGLAKYMSGAGLERVQYTCERYGIRESTHIDVLSYFSIRNDWDPQHPASGVKNLIDGRYKVIDEFAKRGVDVSSEAMRYAFIGKVSLFWHMPRPEACPFGGEPIPMMATIYRHSAIWGEWGRVEPSERTLHCLFYSNSPHAIVETDVNFESLLDSYYLMWLPWSRVHRLKVESFLRDGDRTRIGLERNSAIDLDWGKKSYSVNLNGSEIARSNSTFCQMDDNRIAFYSTEPKELSTPLPLGWNVDQIVSRCVEPEHISDAEHRFVDGHVVVKVESRKPIIVFRNKSSARNIDTAERS